MVEKKLYFESKKCIGCRICEQYCTFTHHQVVNPVKSNIRIYRDAEKQLDFAQYCHLCFDTPCISACDFDALGSDDLTGAIKVIEENCTACENCINSCPFDAIFMLKGEKFVQVCDLCQGDPICVKLCPEQAVIFIDQSEVTT